MKKTRHSDEQIALRQAETGTPVAEVILRYLPMRATAGRHQPHPFVLKFLREPSLLRP